MCVPCTHWWTEHLDRAPGPSSGLPAVSTTCASCHVRFLSGVCLGWYAWLRVSGVCLGFQEVDAGRVWDHLYAALQKLGYTGVHKKRCGDKVDGCATLWKRAKWRSIAYSPVDFNGVGGVRCMDRDNVAQVRGLRRGFYPHGILGTPFVSPKGLCVCHSCWMLPCCSVITGGCFGGCCES